MLQKRAKLQDTYLLHSATLLKLISNILLCVSLEFSNILLNNFHTIILSLFTITLENNARCENKLIILRPILFYPICKRCFQTMFTMLVLLVCLPTAHTIIYIHYTYTIWEPLTTTTVSTVDVLGLAVCVRIRGMG